MRRARRSARVALGCARCGVACVAPRGRPHRRPARSPAGPIEWPRAAGTRPASNPRQALPSRSRPDPAVKHEAALELLLPSPRAALQVPASLLSDMLERQVTRRQHAISRVSTVMLRHGHARARHVRGRRALRDRRADRVRRGRHRFSLRRLHEDGRRHAPLASVISSATRSSSGRLVHSPGALAALRSHLQRRRPAPCDRRGPQHPPTRPPHCTQ